MNMKPKGLFAVVVVLLLTTTIASVARAQYAPTPIVIPRGPVFNPNPSVGIVPSPPVLAGTKLSGFLTVNYPDERPVTVTQTTVTLQLCTSAGCSPVTATLTQTAPGTYSYSFTVPSTVTGAVSIMIPAGSLTDGFGTSFPGANTVIGTFTA